MPSFDVVSKVDWAEVTNALNQAEREIGQRFDFKGTGASIERAEEVITLWANSEERVRAILEVIREKLIRRKVSLKHLDPGEPTPGARSNFKLVVKIKEGIEQEKSKKLIKMLKDSKLKVQAAIQEDAVRVTGKKRDDLQEAIAQLRQSDDLDLDLQFINFRD
jgi:uncharacterized protein YajQ (UPF0234 family)